MTTRDHGLQPERTALSWRRTALSSALVAALLVRNGLADGAPVEIAAAACLIMPLVAARVRSAGRRPRSAILMAGIGVLGAGLLTIAQVLLQR